MMSSERKHAVRKGATLCRWKDKPSGVIQSVKVITPCRWRAKISKRRGYLVTEEDNKQCGGGITSI